ncbi:phosphatase PAP2 family protein [Isobaculum melis]|uniref:Undecaprenyl-diphosphatase n=1 Tax=Isobaculum melis TaxID=142588 RepID=A0A1H9TQY1_9LACT|nr:phosphatase PAP2 family protein [Isobaculum melis]SER99431.1 undecaprenyl-diphosphatase [Isobaculum melis]
MQIKNKWTWGISWLLPLSLFSFIAFNIQKNTALRQQFDTTITSWVRGNMTDLKTTFFKSLTQLGNPLVVVLLSAVIVLFLLKKKEITVSLWFVQNMALGAGLLNKIMKEIFRRPRPDLTHLVVEKSWSFPSGHSMASMMFFGSLIYLSYQTIQNRWLKTSLICLASIMILMIGISRIYLGVHYPSDILGGYLLALTWLCFTVPLFKKRSN